MSKDTKIRDGATAKIPTQGGDRSYLPDGSVSEQKLQDLAATTNKIGDKAVTPEKVADATIGFVNKHYKNYIINGDMRIAQRGTSFASASSGYTLDRWSYFKSGAMVHTVTQDTDVPTISQVFEETGQGFLFQNSLRLNLTTPDTSIASTDFVGLSQQIEGFNWCNIAQKSLTISFWVKATLAGVYSVALRNSGGDRSYIGEYTINSSGMWEYKTVSVLASPSSGTWNYTNGIGATLLFAVACGASLQANPGSWQSVVTGAFASPNQVNGANTGATDFRITGVMLNEGEVAAPFRTFGGDIEAELRACQRYLETKSLVEFKAYNPSISSVGSIGGWVSFSTNKRATPTVTLSNQSYEKTANAATEAASTGGFGLIGDLVSGSSGRATISVSFAADAEL
jgi:hypothetical protein